MGLGTPRQAQHQHSPRTHSPARTAIDVDVGKGVAHRHNVVRHAHLPRAKHAACMRAVTCRACAPASARYVSLCSVHYTEPTMNAPGTACLHGARQGALRHAGSVPPTAPGRGECRSASWCSTAAPQQRTSLSSSARAVQGQAVPSPPPPAPSPQPPASSPHGHKYAGDSPPPPRGPACATKPLGRTATAARTPHPRQRCLHDGGAALGDGKRPRRGHDSAAAALLQGAAQGAVGRPRAHSGLCVLCAAIAPQPPPPPRTCAGAHTPRGREGPVGVRLCTA